MTNTLKVTDDFNDYFIKFILFVTTVNVTGNYFRHSITDFMS